MINGLLDLAKIEARKMDVFVALFSLNDLLAEITQMARPLMAKNENEFRVVSDPSIDEMRSDEAKLRQCLVNLLGNAAKFTHRGTIELTVRRETGEDGGAWAVFDVADTGIGMTEDQLGRVFESFSQADTSISRRFGGTGLGLTLTKQYCEMIGGQLSVKSVLNHGTTFTMKVPMRLSEPST
jgi:signal transduction histidine kinase